MFHSQTSSPRHGASLLARGDTKRERESIAFLLQRGHISDADSYGKSFCLSTRTLVAKSPARCRFQRHWVLHFLRRAWTLLSGYHFCECMPPLGLTIPLILILFAELMTTRTGKAFSWRSLTRSLLHACGRKFGSSTVVWLCFFEILLTTVRFHLSRYLRRVNMAVLPSKGTHSAVLIW